MPRKYKDDTWAEADYILFELKHKITALFNEKEKYP